MENRFELFTVSIARLSRSIRRIKTKEMEEFNLTSAHVSCLYYLYKLGPLTSSELCIRCIEDKASISRSLEELEKHGLIFRESQQKKRYNCPLSLTDGGRKIAEKVSYKIDRILEQASKGLSEEDRIIMYRSLETISNNLDKICNNYGE